MPFILALPTLTTLDPLQHHIKKPMYLCPYCNFSSCYSPASVKDHIKTRHSIYEPVPIDMRDEYTELIQSVYDQCFLDDPNTFLNRFLLRQKRHQGQTRRRGWRIYQKFFIILRKLSGTFLLPFIFTVTF
ncbi:hypothetical protein Y032_0367g42 [Ancylostoma ceylanicum]|uniref:Uncharacterized protein n=1 Tax=Ancylostoma ceylanicum TaxID=53326 RepID=A0A016RVJ6_9BILA|nr:hypothetical protein Y032_0367g42 [Ancylostoma ceylanicum]